MKAVIRRALESGVVLPGELVPSQRELASYHHLGWNTVRKAMDCLVMDGLLRRLPRVGYAILGREKCLAVAGPVGLVFAGLGQAGLAASQTVAAIEARLAAFGRPLMIGCSGLDAERENDCIRRFREAGAVGLIVRPAARGKRSRELEDWITQGRPVVLQGHPGNWLLPDELAERCDQVTIDNAGGVREAFEYLTGLGHRRIAFASSDPTKGSERLAAFRTFSREMGMPLDRRWQLTGLPRGREGGSSAFAKLAAAQPQPTAVLCADDDTALSLIDAAREARLRVPRDFSVVGFGNESAEGSGALGDLTTLNFLREQDGAETVRLLDERLRGIRRQPERIRVPVHLVVRESCARPRVAKRKVRKSKPASARVNQ